MIIPKQVNLSRLAYLSFQKEEELEIQARVVTARERDAGSYNEQLANEAADLMLGTPAEEIEGINVCRITNNTITHRVSLTSVSSNDETTNEWLTQMWDGDDLNIKQRQLTRGVVRDGESFMLAEWLEDDDHPSYDDPETPGRLTWTVHDRYTSSEVGGDNQGCKAHYSNDDVNQRLLMVTHRWITEELVDDEFETMMRMNLYVNSQGNMPARIEKYISEDGEQWNPHRDLDAEDKPEEWPLWWTENQTETGKSLPFPAVHFHNPERTPTTKPVWGIQAGLDETWAAFTAATVTSAFQILAAFGFWPTTDGRPPQDDGSNLIRIRPRSIIGSVDKGGSLTSIPPGNIRQVSDAIDKMMIYAAFVLGMPIGNFMFSRNVAGGETLRQGESELVAVANELKDLMGRRWKSLFIATISLTNHFSGSTMDNLRPPQLHWQPIEMRNVENDNRKALSMLQTGVPAVYIAQEIWGIPDSYIQDWEKRGIFNPVSQNEEEAPTTDNLELPGPETDGRVHQTGAGV